MVSEVISRVERRRRWPTAEKLRVLSEALAPGATIAGVADRHDVCRSQIYAWLRLARTDRLLGISVSPQMGQFVIRLPTSIIDYRHRLAILGRWCARAGGDQRR